MHGASIEHIPLITLDAVRAKLSTGCASGRYAVPPLHPWLQPVAPLGRERTPPGSQWYTSRRARLDRAPGPA